MESISCLCQHVPVLTGLLKVLDTILQLPFLAHKFLHFDERVLARVLLEYGKTFTQVFVFLLQLEDLGVEIVEALALTLNSLSQR